MNSTCVPEMSLSEIRCHADGLKRAAVDDANAGSSSDQEHLAEQKNERRTERAGVPAAYLSGRWISRHRDRDDGIEDQNGETPGHLSITRSMCQQDTGDKRSGPTQDETGADDPIHRQGGQGARKYIDNQQGRSDTLERTEEDGDDEPV